MTARLYEAYGHVVSSDVALVYLPSDADAATVTLTRARVRRDPALPLVHELDDFPGGPVLRIWLDPSTTRCVIDYAGWAFSLDPIASSVCYESVEDEHPVELSHVIERVVLPLFVWFSDEGVHALHGSALELDGRSFVLIGDSGSGKSTSAAALVERGASLIADDMALVDTRRLECLPGAPTLRLWDGAFDTSNSIRSEPILGLDGKRWYLYEPTPLGAPSLDAIVVLERDPEAPTRGVVAPMSGLDALRSLLAQSFDVNAPDPSWLMRRMASARALVSSVPILRLSFAPSPDREPEHVEALIHWFDEES